MGNPVDSFVALIRDAIRPKQSSFTPHTLSPSAETNHRASLQTWLLDAIGLSSSTLWGYFGYPCRIQVANCHWAPSLVRTVSHFCVPCMVCRSEIRENQQISFIMSLPSSEELVDLIKKPEQPYNSDCFESVIFQIGDIILTDFRKAFARLSKTPMPMNSVYFSKLSSEQMRQQLTNQILDDPLIKVGLVLELMDRSLVFDILIPSAPFLSPSFEFAQTTPTSQAA